MDPSISKWLGPVWTLYRPRRRYLVGALVCLLLPLCVCQPTRGEGTVAPNAAVLEKRVRQASRGKNYQPPSIEELRAAERLFARTLLTKEPFEALRDAWAELHFDLEVLESRDDPIWLLRESDSFQTGRGFYVFRVTAAAPVVLQAPHSFADKHTRRLTARMFLDGRFGAAAWNTVHRKYADVAHTDVCWLNAFTRAILKVHQDDAVICQLHGFARTKRTTPAGRASDLIVSNGTRSGALWLQRTTSILRDTLEVSVRLFPDDVFELGATTNRQARLIRQYGVGKFLHLEMSLELRNTLLSQPSRQTDLLKAFERAFRTKSGEYAIP